MNKIYLTLLALFAALGVNAATYTAYYYNTDGKTTVKAYCWDDNHQESNAFSGGWSGTNATKIADKLYKYSFEFDGTLSNPKIIFNDGNNNISSTDNVFENNYVYDTTGKTTYTIDNIWKYKFNGGSYTAFEHQNDDSFKATVTCDENRNNSDSSFYSFEIQIDGKNVEPTDGNNWKINGETSFTLKQGNAYTFKIFGTDIKGKWDIVIKPNASKEWEISFTKHVEVDNNWYYQVNSNAKVQFTGNTSATLELTKGDTFKILKGDKTYSNGSNANVNLGENLSTTLSQNNYYYNITTTGTYTFTLSNTDSTSPGLDVKVVPATIAAPTNLFVVGSIGGNNWDPQNAIQQTVKSTDGKIFLFKNISVNNSEFYFLDRKDTWTNINSNGIRYSATPEGSNDNKNIPTLAKGTGTAFAEYVKHDIGGTQFKIAENGNVDIVVDFNNATVTYYNANSYVFPGTVEDTAKWYYQVNSGAKTEFGSSLSQKLTLNVNDKVYIFKDNQKYSNGAASDVTLLSDLSATSIFATDFGYAIGAKGDYTFTLSNTDTASPSLAVAFKAAQTIIVSAANFSYSTDDSNFTEMKKVDVADENGQLWFSQWQVTLNTTNGQKIYFKLGNDKYGVDAGDTGYWLNSKNHLFKNFYKNGTYHNANNGGTFTFIIRKMAAKTTYEICVKYVNISDNFVAIGTDDLGTTFNDAHETINLGDGAAGALFAVSTSYEIGGGTHTTGQNITASVENPTSHNMAYHWTKFEHPFWQGNSIQTMKPTSGVAADQDCGKVLYYSDTYLHSDDPRAVYHFGNSIYRQYHLDGKRSHAVNRNAGATHNCRNFSNAYYRVYVTLDGEHGAIENPVTTNAVKPAANGIGIREVVNTGNAKGTRIAYTEKVPDNTTGIDDIIADEEADLNAPAVYFNLQGVQIANPEAGQVYIVRRGTTTTKELYR